MNALTLSITLRYFIYPDQRRSSAGGTPTNLSSKDERTSQSPTTHTSNAPSSGQHGFKSSKGSSSSSSSTSKSTSSKDIKTEEKEHKVKQEGQKPTMETQGPPPPPTSQYYLPYMGPGGNPFFPDASHPMYRNMLVPPAPYSTPYLQMTRFSSPEDLSRNPNTKALDLLQQHANQYNHYNTHKIHELSERVSQMKSPTSNPKLPVTSVASPNISQPLPGNNVTSANQISNASMSSNTSIINNNLTSLSTSSSASLSASQQPSSKSSDKLDRVEAKDPLSGSNGSLNRTTSPPPQRHVHTHHHTHVGIGYPGIGIGYPTPYRKL